MANRNGNIPHIETLIKTELEKMEESRLVKEMILTKAELWKERVKEIEKNQNNRMIR